MHAHAIRVVTPATLARTESDSSAVMVAAHDAYSAPDGRNLPPVRATDRDKHAYERDAR